MTTKLQHLQDFGKLVKLQKLSSLLLSAKSSKEAASIIINEGFAALDSICGDVSLLDKDINSLRILEKRGYEDAVVDDYHALGKNIPLLTKDAISTRKPIFIEDVNILDEKYIFAREFQRKTNSKATAILPLLARGKAFGVLQFAFPEARKFTQEDKNFMLSLANQCANALDRMIALESERKSRQELDTILETIDDGVIVRNGNGEITFVNDATIKMFKFNSVEKLLYLSHQEYYALFSEALDGKGNPITGAQFPFMQALLHKKKFKDSLFIRVKETNKKMWVEATAIPIINNRKVDFVVTVFHDITEEKERENSKDEFFGIASHELKTPVTSLKAYTQLLEKRFLEEGNMKDARILGKMDSQIDKLTHLIRDLLDITKIEAGRMHFTSELFECNMLVADVVEQMQLMTNKHIIQLKKSGDVVVLADKERIIQVLTNFLSNAIKYSPEEKEIIVKLENSKDEVKVSVQDFGIGISPEDKKHVFERYFREKSLQGNTFPGLGLGLYIASQIIRRQGGTIGVESEKGKGSTFFFSLPRYQR